MTRLTKKCPIKVYATVQLDNVPHVVNFFAEHLQFLLDATNNDDLPFLVSELTHEQLEIMLLSQPQLQITLNNKSLAKLKLIQL